MSTTSVKLVLRKDKVRKDGTAPIWIRVTKDRRSRYRKTGVRVDPQYWLPKKQEISSTHELADAYNKKIKELYLKASREALKGKSAKAIQAAVHGDSGSLTAYLQQHIDALGKVDKKYWEHKRYKVTLNKLKACFGEQIQFKDITPQALDRFEQYLVGKRKNNPNTVRKELSRLKRIFRMAERDGEIEKNPFRVYDMPAGTKPNRRKLSFDVVKKLADLELDGFHAVTRDAFLFSFYAGGMRFGDVCLLKPTNIRDGRLDYVMQKTGTHVSVPLPPPALEIVDRYRSDRTYLFPFLTNGAEKTWVHVRKRIGSNNTLVNDALKEIAEIAEIRADGLSFHVSRHSYADFARRKSGDLYAVSKTLGHTSLAVTQQYLREMDRDVVDNLADTLWGSD